MEKIQEIINQYMKKGHICIGVKELAYKIDNSLNGNDYILYKQRANKHYVGISTQYGYVILTMEFITSWITNDCTLQITSGKGFYTQESLYKKNFKDIEEVLEDEE